MYTRQCSKEGCGCINQRENRRGRWGKCVGCGESLSPNKIKSINKEKIIRHNGEKKGKGSSYPVDGSSQKNGDAAATKNFKAYEARYGINLDEETKRTKKGQDNFDRINDIVIESKSNSSCGGSWDYLNTSKNISSFLSNETINNFYEDLEKIKLSEQSLEERREQARDIEKKYINKFFSILDENIQDEIIRYYLNDVFYPKNVSGKMFIVSHKEKNKRWFAYAKNFPIAIFLKEAGGRFFFKKEIDSKSAKICFRKSNGEEIDLQCIIRIVMNNGISIKIKKPHEFSEGKNTCSILCLKFQQNNPYHLLENMEKDGKVEYSETMTEKE